MISTVIVEGYSSERVSVLRLKTYIYFFKNKNHLHLKTFYLNIVETIEDREYSKLTKAI